MLPLATRCFVLFVLTLFAAGCKPAMDEPQAVTGGGSAGVAKAVTTVVADREMVVEAACGQCQFGLEGGGCDLAVRFDGNAYYVDGTSIDEHGDAHGENGFCNTVLKARVKGHVDAERFVVSSFALVPGEDE